MNSKIAIHFNSISLAAVFVLALSPSPGACADKDALISITAGSNSDDSAPAFLNYAKEQQAQKNSEPAKSVEDKSHITKTTNNKNSAKSSDASRQAVIIAQKDKLIRQLRQQLDAKPATVAIAAGTEKELTDKIQQLEKKLTIALAEKQQLINKELSSAADIKQSAEQTSTTENRILQQENKIRLAESEKQKLVLQLAQATNEKQELITKLTSETKEKLTLAEKLATSAPEKQAFTAKLEAADKLQQQLTVKLTEADAAQQALKSKLDASEAAQKELATKLSAFETEKQDLTARLATAAVEKKALTAKLDSYAISKQQSELQEDAARTQADNEKAQLLAYAEEIKQLKAKLSDAQTKTGKQQPDIDLAKEPQQQAYSVGVSMGEEALKVLATRDAQGIKISKDTVLQGILDSFSGKIALDDKVRNKALFDVSKKVFQSLNKIEQQTISDGKKYQQQFAKQKGVVFKDGVYSRIDYAGEGKIHDTDTVTVTIKETLIDGTVINDMEAEGKVWSQTLKSYPPVFLGPIKRLGNHGAITVVIPAELAYGSEGRPPKIPPGATMVYSVRIVDATPAQPQAKKP